ncbi:MAG: 50S ribosomal protein L25 [Dehalococcoidia bacterium]|nr:50S ribosomal protein L25 [Dehalococcoidia bacterium]MCB9485447.1 50S ribosomal protein L25 [Thermoflexaceae bacterium]
MADRVSIPARRREVIGKKVRHIRREGRLPANIFGKGLESVAIELDAHGFAEILKHSGARPLFDLALDGESSARPVVIRSIARQGGTGPVHHVDFYQVDTRRPIVTSVPLLIVGESPAVRDLAGTLVTQIDTVSVRCLPLAIPDVIEADVSKVVSFDVTLTVGDLVVPEGVEIVTDASVPVATALAPRLRLAGEDGGPEDAAEAETAAEDAAADEAE